jgi:hypothetical protein
MAKSFEDRDRIEPASDISFEIQNSEICYATMIGEAANSI